MPGISGGSVIEAVPLHRSEKTAGEKVIIGGREEKRKITEKIKERGPKAVEKTETKLKMFVEQLKELRKTAEDKIARATWYITAGTLALAGVGITSTVGELLKLGLPQNSLELGFAASITLIGYGFGKAVEARATHTALKKLEKEMSATIKEDLEKASGAKIKGNKDEVKPDKSMIIKLGKAKDEKD